MNIFAYICLGGEYIDGFDGKKENTEYGSQVDFRLGNSELLTILICEVVILKGNCVWNDLVQ